MLGALALVLLVGTSGSPVPGPAALGPSGPDGAPPVSAEIRPSKTEVPLGEEFELDVLVRGPAGTTWTWPTEALSEEVELRSLARAASPGAWPPDTHRYAGVLYALDEVELPPLVLRYRLPDGTEGEITPAAVKIRGSSVLVRSEGEAQLADVRPPVSLEIGQAFFLVLAAFLAALGLAAFLVWRRRRKTAGPALAPPESAPAPDLEALAALDGLLAEALASRGDLRGHYIRLTAIAKRYLERRLQAPVLEMTTAETLAFLRDDARGRESSGVMRDVSFAADAVKFARGTAAVEEARRHLEAVRTMVIGTEIRLAAAEATAKPDPAAVAATSPGAPLAGGQR